ncbi:LPS assembly protein LptD [candidate division KSB1 bacterium]
MKKSFLNIFLLLFSVFICFFPGESHAQIQDSIKVRSLLPDSILAGNFNSFVSEADSINMGDDKVILYGSENKPAKITYEEMILEAIKITRYLDGDSIIAEGLKVKADRDSFPEGFRWIGLPVYTQKDQNPVTGLRMVYNIETKKAKVINGRTKFEGGYYFGENITRPDEEFLQIKDGTYSTCDLEEPHYFFKSSQMKMKIKDKVVAKPVILYIRNVPIFMVPFGVFPVHGGRNSGFIMPSYGESRAEGRFLRGIGYYYAPNDYLDTRLLMDYFEKSGVMFRGETRYNIRYKMSGNISGSITRKQFADQELRRWDLNIRHSQIIDPTLSITANGNFISDNSFNKSFKFNRNDRALRRLYSAATISKKWEESKNSITVNLTRTEDLETGRIDETLPSVYFNRSTPTYLFKRNNGSSNVSAGETERFYTNLSFNYNSKLIHRRSKFRPTEFDPFDKTKRSGVEHNLNIVMPMNLFKYFSLSPSLRYKEEWYNEALSKRVDENDNTLTDTEKGFFTRRTGSLSLSSTTKIYGMFNPNIGSLKSVRHVMTPSLSFTYRPDYSDPKFGYFDSYADTSGMEIYYDKFGNALFGGTSRGESKSLGISLQNLFQVKTESDGTENKFDFMNISMSTSYNYAAPDNSRKLSDLSTSYRLMKFANLVMNTRHSFYSFDPVTNTRTNNYLFDSSKSWRKKQFIQLTSLSASTSISIKSNAGESGTEAIEDDVFNDELAVSKASEEDLQDRFEDPALRRDQLVPWELNMNIQYRLNRFNPNNVIKMLTSDARLKVKVTDNWDVEYRGYFDIKEQRIVSQDFSIYRDLHCWEFRMNWTPPNSSRAGFMLEIRVKDPKLRDLRVKKTDYGGSAIGYRG